jgi:ubiquinone/menaquinone biosynthesis C-methylase UbiE
MNCMAWQSHRLGNRVRYLLDDWLPPVIREFRPLTHVLMRLWNGPNFDMDFKRKAFDMSDEEFAAAYVKRSPDRPTDLTEKQIEWMVRNALGPEVLEVGCGNGYLAERLVARADFKVTATDLSESFIEAVRRRLVGSKHVPELRTANVERLPFADKSIDSSLTAHTLEHVRSFEKAIAELVRVTRKRILIIVPKQRYYRYTVDYHLSFFPEPEQLILRIGLPKYHCETIDGDLCYYVDL